MSVSWRSIVSLFDSIRTGVLPWTLPGNRAIAYGEDGYDFWVQLPNDKKPASVGNGVHVAFCAKTKQAVQAFYDAAFPRLEDAATYLERYDLSALPDDAKRLLWLFAALVTVSFPVEVWRQPRVPDSGASAFEAIAEPGDLGMVVDQHAAADALTE